MADVKDEKLTTETEQPKRKPGRPKKVTTEQKVEVKETKETKKAPKEEKASTKPAKEEKPKAEKKAEPKKEEPKKAEPEKTEEVKKEELVKEEPKKEQKEEKKIPDAAVTFREILKNAAAKRPEKLPEKPVEKKVELKQPKETPKAEEHKEQTGSYIEVLVPATVYRVPEQNHLYAKGRVQGRVFFTGHVHNGFAKIEYFRPSEGKTTGYIFRPGLEAKEND